MTFEFVVAIGIIVLISEAKEWRASKRIEEINKRLDSGFQALSQLHKELKFLKESISELSNQVYIQNSKIDSLVANYEAVAQNAEQAKIAGETILKEYELNGIPLGMIRNPNADVIEGF